jgi:hypothetical protein
LCCTKWGVLPADRIDMLKTVQELVTNATNTLVALVALVGEVGDVDSKAASHGLWPTSGQWHGIPAPAPTTVYR